MLKLSLFRRRKQNTSRALVRQRLEDSDIEDSTDIGDHELPNTEKPHLKGFLPRCSSEEGLLGCKSWLHQLCQQKQDQVGRFLEDDYCHQVGFRIEGPTKDKNGQSPNRALTRDCCSSESAVLGRVREGQEPRDKVPEDLLAALRDKPPQNNHTESYGDMRTALLTWNRRVTGNAQEDEDARELLRNAIERRVHLLKAPARGSDKSRSLEESSSELLQALTALRPEIADFKNQAFLDVLVMMWANVRIAIPDLDDELKVLTMNRKC